MPLPKGKTNNPRGNPRGSRNAAMTRREKTGLDEENTGRPSDRAKVIARRAAEGGNS